MLRGSLPPSRAWPVVCALVELAAIAFLAHPGPPGPEAERVVPGHVASRPGSAHGRPTRLTLPIVFEPNRGQAPRDAAFVARGPGYAMQIAANNARLHVAGAGSGHAGVLEMRLDGASPRARIDAEGDEGGRSHYIFGSDRSSDIIDIPQFNRLVGHEVYPGIDVVYRGVNGRLEYDFVVAPGRDPAAIALRFSGQSDIRLTADGALAIRVGDHEVRHERPALYQLPGHDPVDGRFTVDAEGAVRFEVASWDRRRTLVIDPVLVFGTYLGGSAGDRANGVAVDSSGNIYVVGTTASIDFPTTNPYQATNAGNTDAFVTKINAAGTSIVYSTYLGTNYHIGETGTAIAVDSAGSVYVAGAASPGFPTTASPLNSCLLGSLAFVTKLTPSGNSLSYSICFGSGGSERVNGIAVDGSTNAYLTGTNGSDATVRRLNATGTAWVYNLALSGSGTDEGFGIGVDAAGNACVAGQTWSTNFPVVNALQPTNSALTWTAFAAKYTPAGAPVFVTYLGGSVWETGYGAAIDAGGNCYVAGSTNSPTFPIANGAQPIFRGASDAFLTAYNASGSAYLYSTFLGGAQSDSAYAVSVTPTGVVSVVGETASFDFPAVSPLQPGIKDLGAAHVSVTAGSTFSISGLTGVSVHALAIDPTNAQVMYAGTAAGIYKSTNGGTNWARVDSGLVYTNITSLAIDPNDPCVVYAGVDSLSSVDSNGVLVVSRNCGSSWTYAISDFVGRTVRSVAFTNANPAVLYWGVHRNLSGGTHGVGRTTSIGFEQSFLPGYYHIKVAVDPANPCTVYAGETFGTVLRNTSCAAWNWTQVGAALTGSVNALAPHPTNQATVLAGTSAGIIYRRADASSPWTAVSAVAGSINALVYQPGSTQVVYAASSGGVVHKSIDGGVTWNPVGTIGPRVSSLAVSPSAPSVVAAGTTTDFDTFYAHVGPGGALVVSSWIGGYGLDRGLGVAVTPGGDAVVVGQASSNWPATASAPFPAPQGGGDAFVARVDPLAPTPNTPPTISDLADQTVAQGSATGPIPFTVGDAESPAESLALTAASSNTTLVPLANIVFGGAGAGRTVTVTPPAGRAGVATITVTVSDGSLTASDVFVLTVLAGPNTAPTIGDVPNVTVGQGGTSGPLAFTVGDAETPAGSLVVSAASSNPTLLPVGNIVVGGSDASRTVTVTPAAGLVGASIVTLTVSDGSLTATDTFLVTVTSGPVPVQPPTGLYVSSVAGNVVTLRWTAPASGPTPTGFVLEGGVNQGEVLASLPTGSAYPVHTFTAPTGSFYVRMHSLDGLSRSLASNELRIHVNVPVAPSAPVSLLGLSNGSALALAWKNTLGGGAPASVMLQVTGSIVTSLPLGPVETFTFAGVPAGTYTFAVRAQNGAGLSPPTNPVTLTFPGTCAGPPLAPSNFLAYRLGATVLVAWDPPASGSAPTGYVLNVTGAYVGSFATTTRTMSGTVGPGAYALSVVATNACGTSSATVPQTVTVP